MFKALFKTNFMYDTIFMFCVLQNNKSIWTFNWRHSDVKAKTKPENWIFIHHFTGFKTANEYFYGVGRGLVVTSLLIVPFNYKLIFFLQTHTKSKNWSKLFKSYIKHRTTFLTCRTLFRRPSWLPWEWRRQRREQRWWRGRAWLTSSGSCRRGIPTRETRGSWRHPTVICC